MPHGGLRDIALVENRLRNPGLPPHFGPPGHPDRSDQPSPFRRIAQDGDSLYTLAMLAQRVTYGTLLIVGLLAIFWGDAKIQGVVIAGHLVPPGLLLLGLMVTLAIPASWELATILTMAGNRASAPLIAIGVLSMLITFYFMDQIQGRTTGIPILTSVLMACFFGTLVWHATHREVSGAMASAGATMLGVTYLGLGAGFMMAIRQEHSAYILLAIIITTKLGDMGAYFTGKMIGRHKLIPWLSPGKTWEGLAGALVWSAAGAAILAWLTHLSDTLTVTVSQQGGLEWVYPKRYPVAAAVALGAILALVGHAGDLTMSLFKRDAGVKDSGKLIPGMGGALDILDSPLLAAPVAYWLLRFA